MSYRYLSKTPEYSVALGFTTVELIATLIIAGILAALAGFSFFGVRDPLGNATEEAANALKYSRSLAIATTSACRTRASALDTLTIECSNVCTAAAGWANAQTSPTHTFDEVQIAEVNGAPVTPGDIVVCFDSRGAASNAASLQLSFADDGVVTTSDINVLLGGAVSTP